MALGSCNISLITNVKGITTTNIATTRAEIHKGMSAGAPTLRSESTFDTIAIRPVGGGPCSGGERDEILFEQRNQAVFRLLPAVFTANDFHRRLEIPQLPDSVIDIQRFHQ